MANKRSVAEPFMALAAAGSSNATLYVAPTPRASGPTLWPYHARAACVVLRAQGAFALPLLLFTTSKEEASSNHAHFLPSSHHTPRTTDTGTI